MEQIKPEELASKCNEASQLLKHLAHPGRLMLLCLMKDGEYTVTQLAQNTQMSTSAVSQALTKMHHAQLVSKKKIGVETFYTISNNELQMIMASLADIYCK